MNYDENTKRMLSNQSTSCADSNNIMQIIKDNNSIYLIASCAYHLGMINGKRAERARRNVK